MGFSQSWIAVQGVEQEQALAALGMKIAERVSPQDIDDWADIVILGQMKEDCLFVVSGDAEDAFDGSLARLAELGPATAFQVSESTMYAEARGYEDGEEIWRFVHDPDEGESLYAMEVSGTLPAQLNAIMRKARAEQDAEGGEEADVDCIFEIPGSFSKLICGYKPGDEEPEGFTYSILEPINAARVSARRASSTDRPKAGRGFFARLFGR